LAPLSGYDDPAMSEHSERIADLSRRVANAKEYL
jgi:hypothetical protein